MSDMVCQFPERGMFFKWIMLGIIALLLSSVLSIASVAFNKFLPLDNIIGENYSEVFLIVNMNLSILICFFSVICAFISLNIDEKSLYIEKGLWYLALGGTVLVFSSIFVPDTEVIMSNYIPVVQNILFFSGISLFVVAILMLSVVSLRSINTVRLQTDFLTMGSYSLAFLINIMFVTFVFAFCKIPAELKFYNSYSFYQYVFWGGGHVMQYAFSLLLVLSCVSVMKFRGIDFPLSFKAINYFVILHIIFASTLVFPYFVYDIFEEGMISFYVNNMQFLSGLLPLSVIISAFYSIIKSKRIFYKYFWQDCALSSLFFAIIIFLSGCVFGFISSSIDLANVLHHHCMVVGVTIFCMSFIHAIFYPGGPSKYKNYVISSVQPYFYGLGQIIYVVGLIMYKGEGENYSIIHSLSNLGSILSVLGMLIFILCAVKEGRRFVG